MRLDEIIHRVIYDILSEKRSGFGYAGGGDEYYTTDEDVKNIITRISHYLKGKVVYCPCANPNLSKFYKYLKDNFSNLGLAGVYTTWMENKACYYDGEKEHIYPIKSGRFQDTDEFFENCDVVITNPPFSKGQPSQMLSMINSHGKDYVMIADKAFTQLQSVFGDVATGRMNSLDYEISYFDRPNGSISKVPTAVYTSFDDDKPYFQTGIKYDPLIHKKFDNYDAIDCGDNYNLIPDDYMGNIAISSNGAGFLRKFNRGQFEIVDKLVRPKMNGVPKKRMIIRRIH